MIALLALAVAWALVWAWPSLAARWRRRRQVTRLSRLVLDDVRSRVGVAEVGGTQSWGDR